MSAIGGDLNAITGAALSPQQQADSMLLPAPSTLQAGETPVQQSDATLLDITGSSASVASKLQAAMPPDLAAASTLVSNLVSQISQLGPQASSMYSLLSAESTLKLTQA